MRLDVASASGQVMRYETGSFASRRIAGAGVSFLPATITTRDKDGAVVRRLREDYAPTLLTALRGEFEEPTGAGEWRTVREFSLREIRAPHAAGAAPHRRTHHALVHHAGEGRTYLIGGSTRRGEGYHYFDDMWFWNGTDWTEVSPLPFPRSSHGVVYHAERDSLILFGGGFGRAVRAEGVLWEWRAGGWKAVGGNTQAGRSEPGMCYDQGRGRVVIFGGWDAANTYRGGAWEWAGAELAEVASTGPGPRAGHAFLFDPVRKRCLCWDEVSTDGPSARMGVKLAGSERGIVLFGGREATSEGFQDHDDTWELQKHSWVRRD